MSLATVILSATVALGAQLELRQVALSGEMPSGVSADDMFQVFTGAPVIDNRGQVAFLPQLGPGSAASSVWSDSNAGLRMLAKSGDSAPTTGAAFAQFSDIVIADGGVIVFKATLAGTTIGDDNRESIWLDRSGALALVAQTGGKAPNPTADLRFSHFETTIAVNRDGQTAFFARTRNKEGGTEQSSGIWSVGSSGVSIAANDHTTGISGLPDVVFLPQSFE
jgi:hypothetical protein